MRSINNYQFNILERTKRFSVDIIKLSSELPKNPAGFTLADQLVRAATSIGANLIEAQEAVSKSEFYYKINIALKESKETMYWLSLINDSKLLLKTDISSLLQESEEIVKILVAIARKLKNKK